MKKLITLLFIVAVFGCSEQKSDKYLGLIKKSWHNQGYTNPNNENEFIVNDSISIIATSDCMGLGYSIYVNDKKIMVKPSVAYRTTYDNIEQLIDMLENRYRVMGTKREYGYTESPFKF